jgi:hypothetical protein
MDSSYEIYKQLRARIPEEEELYPVTDLKESIRRMRLEIENAIQRERRLTIENTNLRQMHLSNVNRFAGLRSAPRSMPARTITPCLKRISCRSTGTRRLKTCSRRKSRNGSPSAVG